MRQAVSTDQRAFRVAHMEALTNGFLMLLVGVVCKLASFEYNRKLVLLGALATGYGNALGGGLAVFTGTRGLTFDMPWGNRAVYTLFMIAIIGVVTCLGSLAAGALRGARTEKEDGLAAGDKKDN
jgi:hypothetical protein